MITALIVTLAWAVFGLLFFFIITKYVDPAELDDLSWWTFNFSFGPIFWAVLIYFIYSEGWDEFKKSRQREKNTRKVL
jgi:hypothetical protein